MSSKTMFRCDACGASISVNAADVHAGKTTFRCAYCGSWSSFHPPPNPHPQIHVTHVAAPLITPVSLPTLAEGVLSILREHRSQQYKRLEKLHISPNIGEKLLTNARKNCQVPFDKRILGIVDCSEWPTKNWLVFAEDALYYFHDRKGCVPNPGRIPYEEFLGRTIKQGSWPANRILLGGDCFLSVSGTPIVSIMDTLNSIKELVASRNLPSADKLPDGGKPFTKERKTDPTPDEKMAASVVLVFLLAVCGFIYMSCCGGCGGCFGNREKREPEKMEIDKDR